MGDSSSWPARVLDVSRSGIGIALGRHFKPGSLVSMELANQEGDVARTMLTRVMRCHKLEDGSWLAGCAFAIELDDDELHAFSVQKVAAPAADQRAWVRMPCNIATTLRRTDVPNARLIPVRIRTIAPGGVGMESEVPVEEGSVVHLSLPTGNTVLVRIAVKKNFQDRWLVGAEFTRQLSEFELQSFLCE